jgi:uncharacterized FAD-dependent dehydrogenase
MKKVLELTLKPEDAADADLLRPILRQKAQIPSDLDFSFQILRRSIDARSRDVKILTQIEIAQGEDLSPLMAWEKRYTDVRQAEPVIIIGAGPAGLFAALRLIELGLKPVIFERGKDVRARRRDLAAINKDHVVNPESNYCFGEGGAGTYSDGKLYTRSKKRGDIRRILEILVGHGSTEQILVDAHPHIGTNKLPQVVSALRESILEFGGEIHFESRVDDILTSDSEIAGICLADGTKFYAKNLILATGHSARDIYRLLHRKDIYIEAKSFALGVRVEHPQALIDSIQYHCDSRGSYLPAASYALVEQVVYQRKQRGVFSFCMCPGGFIVPSATAPGEIVVNGMSPSRRDSKYANSGIVVSVEPDELIEYRKFGPLAALEFQAVIEQNACSIAGGKQTAPAQRIVDFVDGKVSANLLNTSYQPGLLSTNMDLVLPPFIAESLKVAFKGFGRKMRGYYSNEGQIIGVESRTSSPVRIPRDKFSLEHPQIAGLYPCGEGAGYAGGIVSAAMDGERVAESIKSKIKK